MAELMLLGLISLLLSQSARWISGICVNSSLFTSQFYICSEEDDSTKKLVMLESSPNKTEIPRGLTNFSHQCGEVNWFPKLNFGRFVDALSLQILMVNCRAGNRLFLMRDWSSCTGSCSFLGSSMCCTVVWLWLWL